MILLLALALVAAGLVPVPGQVGVGPIGFGQAMERAREFVGPPDPASGWAVSVGLAHPRYGFRDSSRKFLVARGERAIHALTVGLADRDPEIRDCCRWALEEIRTGIR